MSDDEPPRKKSTPMDRMKNIRGDQTHNKFERGKDFRVLVVLGKRGLPYKVNTKDNKYVNEFYKYTNDDVVNKDYLQEYIQGEDERYLFDWNTSNGNDHTTTLMSIVPLCMYCVLVLLQGQPQRLFPTITSCPKGVFDKDEPDCIDIQVLRNNLRFTNVESLICISQADESVKDEVARLIGTNFEFICLCDSEGLGLDDFKSYLDYISLYVHIKNQVSLAAQIMMCNVFNY